MNLDDKYIGWDFSNKDLDDFNLGGMFVKSKFRNATLVHALLNGTFVKVDFTGANLSYARLSGSFKDVDFKNADLSYADLTGSNLTKEQLYRASSLRGVRVSRDSDSDDFSSGDSSLSHLIKMTFKL